MMTAGTPRPPARVWPSSAVVLLAASISLHATAQQAPGAEVTPRAAPRAALSLGTARAVDEARGESMTIEQAIQAAVEGSRDIDAARDRVLEATIDVDRAWSTLRPSAALVGSVTRNDEEVLFRQPDGTERIVQRLYQPQITASLRQNIFQGAAIPTIRALRELRAAAELEVAQMTTEVIYAVAALFYAGVAMQETVGLAARQLEDTARHLEVVRARVDVGAANRLDLLRAQTDERSAVEDLRIADASLASLKVALSTLIGRPRDEPDYVLVPPREREQVQVDPAVAVEAALDGRLDLSIIAGQVTAADRLVQAARMAYLPSLDLGANARQSTAGGIARDDRFTWQATVNLTVPLYQGGLRRQQLESAQVRARQARRVQESLRDRARQDVLQALLDVDTAAAQTERLGATAELARETLELVRARYDAGVATSLDVTDATTRAFAAEAAVVRSGLDYDMAVLALARALGPLSTDVEELTIPTE